MILAMNTKEVSDSDALIVRAANGVFRRLRHYSYEDRSRVLERDTFRFKLTKDRAPRMAPIEIIILLRHLDVNQSGV